LQDAPSRWDTYKRPNLDGTFFNDIFWNNHKETLLVDRLGKSDISTNRKLFNDTRFSNQHSEI